MIGYGKTLYFCHFKTLDDYDLLSGLVQAVTFLLWKKVPQVPMNLFHLENYSITRGKLL